MSLNSPTLVTVEEVLRLIDSEAAALPVRTVALEEALGCMLGETIFADADQPAYDRSAIDGFALPEGSLAGKYALVGEVLPGVSAPVAPRAGEVLRVLTGSAVPAGCALVMQEDATFDAGQVTTHVAGTTKMIRRCGSSVRAGAILVAAGVRLGPGELAVLASAGIASPLVTPLPRVLHLTSGREVVPFASRPELGQIRDTNGPLVGALLREAGAVALPRVHVDESVAALVSAVERSAPWDVLLVSGGASVGPHDRTAEALAELGFTVRVRRVNSRPGKPLILARRGAQWAVGLPGNPVSHFATFHVFVARLLRRLARRPSDFSIEARLAESLPGPGDERETFWPARLTRTADILDVQPLPWLDSGDVRALAGVNALIRMPAGAAPRAGDCVVVLPCGPAQASAL